jgi:hypothetical protein
LKSEDQRKEKRKEKKEVKPCGTTWLKRINSNNEKIKNKKIKRSDNHLE